MGVPPWWLAYITLPFLAAYKFTTFRPNGRPASSWMVTMALHRIVPCTRSAGRAVRPTGTLAIAPDLTALAPSTAGRQLIHGVIHGPCRIAFRGRMNIVQKQRGRCVARPAADGAFTDVELLAGERMEVRP